MNNNYKGTEHYTLTKTENGWHGDPDGYSWQWFDFPDLTFTDDGDCRFKLEAEAIDTASELDEYQEFLTKTGSTRHPHRLKETDSNAQGNLQQPFRRHHHHR